MRSPIRKGDKLERGGEVTGGSLMKISKYIYATLFLFSSFTAVAESLLSVTISDGHAYVTTPSGKRQEVSLKKGVMKSDTKFIDLTFNGYADLVVLRDGGANQKFYDVYLYSKERGEYIYSERLSNVPCLSVDQKDKELVGQCFHESSCENWEEHYSVSPVGNISLVERKGTYCDPIGGQGYTYIDRFRNNKKISSKTLPVDNQSNNYIMQSPIRKGDKLEHGGEVTGGSPWFEVMGRPLARKGDEAICEQHGPTTIDEGYAKFPDRDGKEVAFHHYRCACGCRLLSSLVNFNIE